MGAADGITLYNPNQINELTDMLSKAESALISAQDEMKSASQGMEAGWKGDEEASQAYEGFATSYTAWNTEYENALGLLGKMKAAVTNSLGNAQHTDGQIAGNFNA